jgi:hypothetical protein
MARKYGYVDPLLSNLAVDYSKTVREGLVGANLFPRVLVAKPTGKYAVYDKEAAFKVPDVTFADRAEAHTFEASGKTQNYATTSYALRMPSDHADEQFMEGPFKEWEKRRVETIVSKLELAQEKRIAEKVKNIPGRSITLTGVGDGPGKKWKNGKGDPFTDIKEGSYKTFYRPNLMMMNEAVFDTLEYHPALLNKLGDAFTVKKIDEATLAKLFRIDRVIIAKGRADFNKRDAAGNVEPKDIWGDSVVLAYVSNEWDSPCAGKNFCLKFAEADGAGYVVRTWEEPANGMLGGDYVQVGHEADEVVVCPDLLYTIKEVL